MNTLTQKKFSFKFISLLTVAVILLINGITLMRFPSPNGDEAWMASKALAFIDSGSGFGALDEGVMDRIEGYQHFFPWLPSAIQSLGVLLFGEPSLLAMRFISLVSGLLLLIAIYFIGSAFDGMELGIFSVAFTASSLPFFLSAHLGRADIIASTFGYASLAILLNNKKQYHWISAISGFLMVLAFEVHAYAAIYFPTALAIFLWKYRTQILRKLDFWGYIGGVAIGVMAYLGYHVIPNPQAFLRLNQIVFIASRTPPLLTFDIEIIVNTLKEMGFMVLITYPQILLGIWAIYRMVKTRPPYLWTLLILYGALTISFILLVRNKSLLYYAILYSPVMSLLLAAFFYDFVKEPVKTRTERFIRQIIVAGILVFPFVLISRFNSFPDYLKIQSEVNQIVEPGDIIMAQQIYWFGLNEHIYYSWENIAYYRRYKPGSTLDDLLKLLKPDLFIIDNQMENFIKDEIVENKYISEFRIPKNELEEFLGKSANLIHVINPDQEDTIRIYRINWDLESNE